MTRQDEFSKCSESLSPYDQFAFLALHILFSSFTTNLIFLSPQVSLLKGGFILPVNTPAFIELIESVIQS
jgi:hypothetical protein